MVNVMRLRGVIAERGLSINKLSNATGINPNTLYSKFYSKKFGCDDAVLISKALELSDEQVLDIFFSLKDT